MTQRGRPTQLPSSQQLEMMAVSRFKPKKPQSSLSALHALENGAGVSLKAYCTDANQAGDLAICRPAEVFYAMQVPFC